MSPANTLLQQIRSAATPFVARTFRGKRLQRYAALSVLLGMLSVVFGLWISFGTGGFEQEVRRELDIEDARWDLDRETFTVTIDDPYAYAEVRRQRDFSHTPTWWQVDNAIDEAYATLYVALEQAGPMHQAEVEQIEALLAANPPSVERMGGGIDPMRPDQEPDPYWYYTEQRRDYQFDWHSPGSRKRLGAILDAQLDPNIQLYTSPVDAAGAVRLTGAVAGGLVLVLMLIAAPLSAGATVAQEVHENTLQPILGTRLRAKDIVMGMTLSGLALAGLLAAPTMVVLLTACVLSGHILHVVPFVLLLAAASLVLTLFAQLVGLGLGRRWAGGVVAALLTVALSFIVMVGTAMGMGLEDEIVGLIAVSPATGLVHELRQMFAPRGRLSSTELAYAQLASVSAFVVFSTLAWTLARALTRRISGTTQASLTRVEGMVAALAVTFGALVAVPELADADPVGVYFLSLFLALLPWQLILMGRVVTGDGPAALRKAPVSTVLTELAAFVGVHAVAVLLLAGPTAPSLGGAFHLVWTLTVIGLVAVRVVAAPLRVLSGIWVAFCMGSVLCGLGQSVVLVEDASSHEFSAGPNPFLFFEASAVLGVIQLGLTIWIPLSLLLALRRQTAGLR